MSATLSQWTEQMTIKRIVMDYGPGSLCVFVCAYMCVEIPSLAALISLHFYRALLIFFHFTFLQASVFSTLNSIWYSHGESEQRAAMMSLLRTH